MNAHSTIAREDRIQYWKPYIQKALLRAGGKMAFEDILDKVATGCYLWMDTDRAFIVIDPTQDNNGLRAHVLLSGGSRAGMAEIQSILEPILKSMGVKRASALVRPGFWRKPVGMGWKPKAIYIEKEL